MTEKEFLILIFLFCFPIIISQAPCEKAHLSASVGIEIGSAESSRDATLTYASKDRDETTRLFNNSNAWGDHVVLNATYLGSSENLSSTQMILSTIEGNSVNISSSKRTVLYDTYSIGGNTTTDIDFLVLFQNGSIISHHYQSIDIANFFAPTARLYVSGIGLTRHIEWTISDLNQDDNHIVDVYIKSDRNTKWWLWASDLTNSSILWDMKHYYMLNWSLKIQAFDNDTIYRPANTSSNTLWPALNASSQSCNFEGGTTSLLGSIPGTNVVVYWYGLGGQNFSYTEGEAGNRLEMLKRVTFFGARPNTNESPYLIYRNGDIIASGNLSYGFLNINIDSLKPGLYNFTCFVIQEDQTAKDTIFVRVYSSGTALVIPVVFVTSLCIVAYAFYGRMKRRND
jgi:hypothetical protein